MIVRVAAIGIALVLAALFLAPQLDGFFVGDELGQLALFRHWHDEGVLANEVLARFAASLDGVNGFYRPLTFASFAANFLLSDSAAGGWLAVNLTAHAASAALIAVIVLSLSGDRSIAGLGAALLSAIVFLVLPSNAEVATWISGRFDALATLFTLAGLAFFIGSRRPWDRPYAMALALSVAALASKESGALAIASVALFAAARVSQAPSGPIAARVREWIRLAWPWIALGIAYALLRWALFGSATRVYAAAQSSTSLGGLMHALGAWAWTVFHDLPGPRVIASLLVVHIVLATLLAWRAPRPVIISLGALLALVVLSLALLVPHAPIFEPSGVGGRLFYQAAAFACVASGVALSAALAQRGARRGVVAVQGLVAVILAASLAAQGWTTFRRYAAVERQMRAVAGAIADVARAEPAAFHLVLLPAVVQGVVFGRNAQPGLMLPPVQSEELSRRVLVQVDEEIPEIQGKIDRGVIGVLKTQPLFAIRDGRVPKEAWVRVLPDRWWCWSPAHERLVPVMLEGSAGRWNDTLEREMRRAHCRD